MAYINSFCDCGDCSTDFLLPALPTDPNCVAGYQKSEITILLMMPTNATKPTDWTSRTDWEAVLANDNTDNTKGKYLRGIGSLPAPEVTTVRVVDAVDIITYKEFTITHKIRALTDVKYNYLKSLQCNPTNYTFWYYTKADYLFGGSTGIQPFSTDVNFIYDEGKTSIVEAQLVIKWGTESCDPARTSIADLEANFASLTSNAIMLGTGAGVFGDATGAGFS